MEIQQFAQSNERRVIEHLGPQPGNNPRRWFKRNLSLIELTDPRMDLFHHDAIRNLKRANNDGRSLNGDGHSSGSGNFCAYEDTSAETALRPEGPDENFDFALTILQG